MKLGWIGCGKLGLPCALTLQRAGHDVALYDVSDRYVRILKEEEPAPREVGIGELLAATASRARIAGTVADVVGHADVVFVAVQTPHSPEYGGEQPMPAERRDFEYAYLTSAVRAVCAEALVQEKTVTVVVVSTALPGTFNRYLRPLANQYARLIYAPLFIAMGTTIRDFTAPEFVLVGADDRTLAKKVLREVYRPLHNAPIAAMSIESAELTKVAYNVAISNKIVFANTMMEICHKTGADCDEVIDALSMATDRLLSPRYLRGGMGDSGACHPRDLIAMSWLAERLELSVDLLGFLAKAREDQNWWIRDLAAQQADLTGLPIALLGVAYKPESDLTNGSLALLLCDQFGHEVTICDPHVKDYPPLPPSEPHVFVVTTKHEVWRQWDFAAGSVVVDPFGYIPDQPGVTVIRVGRKR